MESTLTPNPGTWLVLASPLFLILAAVVPSSLLDRDRQTTALAARTGAAATLSVFLLSLLSAACLLWFGPGRLSLLQAGPAALTVTLDTLSVLMFVLVSFLGAVVARYSVRYLDGDPRQGHFTKWLCGTIGSALGIIVSGNLLCFILAWTATSLCLHQLLVHYRERPAALLAARKKFIISRAGDLCLLGVLALAWIHFGTWEFDRIFALVEAPNHGTLPLPDNGLFWMGLLLVAGALLKSAQFPFHSWLPDTMETPTPVSALMHAGIINAGGYLIIRFSPLVVQTPVAMDLLVLVGSFTALFASVVMLTQTSIKRSLAFSTIAQMGFMMLQCGLGAFPLALLHLIAHSLYKAHAFLSSGSVVLLSRQAWTASGKNPARPSLLAGAILTAATLSTGLSALFGRIEAAGPGSLILGTVLTLALSYYLWNLWNSAGSAAVALWGSLAATATATAYHALHALFAQITADSLPAYHPVRSPADYVIAGLALAAFLAVFFLQTRLQDGSRYPWWRALYVHALNGFYLGIVLNRLLAGTRPISPAPQNNH